MEIPDMAQYALLSLLRGTVFLAYKGVRCILPDKQACTSVYAVACSHVGENGPGGLNFGEVGNEHFRIVQCGPQEGTKEGCDAVAVAKLEQPYALNRSLADLS
jgi:hypothetical protein